MKYLSILMHAAKMIYDRLKPIEQICMVLFK